MTQAKLNLVLLSLDGLCGSDEILILLNRLKHSSLIRVGHSEAGRDDSLFFAESS